MQNCPGFLCYNAQRFPTLYLVGRMAAFRAAYRRLRQLFRRSGLRHFRTALSGFVVSCVLLDPLLCALHCAVIHQPHHVQYLHAGQVVVVRYTHVALHTDCGDMQSVTGQLGANWQVPPIFHEHLAYVAIPAAYALLFCLLASITIRGLLWVSAIPWPCWRPPIFRNV